MERPELTQLDTFALINRSQEGDSEAIQVLFERHYAALERIVRVRLGPLLAAREGVADIVQDTMLMAHRDLAKFQPREDARFVHWLAKIAVNRIKGRRRHWETDARDLRREVASRPTAGHGR